MQLYADVLKMDNVLEKDQQAALEKIGKAIKKEAQKALPKSDENGTSYRHMRDDVKVTITDGGDTIEQDDMFFYSHLNEDDKYPVYLDGNHPYPVIKNASADSDKKLMVVKDSLAWPAVYWKN